MSSSNLSALQTTASQAHLVMRISSIGIFVSLIAVITVIIAGIITTPSGIIYTSTSCFEALILFSALGIISAIFFAGACLIMHYNTNNSK